MKFMFLIGETLYAGKTGTEAFSPWFDACGGGALFAVEITYLAGGGEMRIDVQTKTTEETDAQGTVLDPVDIAGPWIVDTAKVWTARFEGFEELVRFKYSIPASTSIVWVHFRMLSPGWQHNCLDYTIEKELSSNTLIDWHQGA